MHEGVVSLRDRGSAIREAVSKFRMSKTLLQWQIKTVKEAIAAGIASELASTYLIK